MSSGKVHAVIALAAAPAVTVGALYLGQPWPAAVVYGLLEIAGGTILSPDLDGPCMWEKTWLGAFGLYKKTLKHRSFWSHCPGVGMAGRLIYLAGLIAVALGLLYILGAAVLVLRDVLQQQPLDPASAFLVFDGYLGELTTPLWDALPAIPWQDKASAFLALAFGEGLHTAADYFSSRWKKLRKDHGIFVSLWKVLMNRGDFTGFDWFEGAHHK